MEAPHRPQRAEPARTTPTSSWPLGPVLTEALTRLKTEGRAGLSGVEGAARAFALARLWLAHPRTWLVICHTLPAAKALARDLEFFLAGLGQGQSPVRLFPAYEFSPYQDMEAPPEVRARRLAVLWELVCAERPLVVVTSSGGANSRLCPPEYLVDQALELRPGLNLEREALVEALIRGGYTSIALVEQVGDFAVRGAVVDFFGPLADDPMRVEFFGNRIESIRRFDPNDQCSQLALPSATLIPCHPVDLSPAAVDRAIKALRELTVTEGLSARRLGEMKERMELRVPFTGLESLLSLYHAKAADIFSYLPDERLHVLVEPVEVKARLTAEAEALEKEFHEASEEGRVVLAPPRLRRTTEQTTQRLGERPRLLCKALTITGPAEEDDPSALVFSAPLLGLRAAAHTGLHQELARGKEGSLLARFLAWVARQRDDGRDVLLVCRSRFQVERLGELFAEREVHAKVVGHSFEAAAEVAGRAARLFMVVGGLSVGFAPAELPLTVVTEDEVFGAPRVVRQKAPARLSEMLATLNDLAPGDLVVHVDHGVARYEGLLSLAVGAAESDFLLLIYQDGDKLYLPADRMGLISKYRGPGETTPPLDKMGGKTWSRTKGLVKKAVEAIARDLVELYAARSFQKGHPFVPPDRAFREFEAGFPYEETPDQAKAIEDVLADLTSPQPMDRLICGDVGYGKTEVALRAAYLVAMQDRQVAVLVPTTVLAEQHYQTFAARLADQPLVMESLSRFKTAAEQKKTLKDLAEGRVNIIIGTHRLLQKDVVFKNVGLLVVDEEHRFGVQDKERLKKLRKLVDVLTLTATPIPRTLQLSLSGIRDLSVINTPPADRQAIKTYLATFSPKALREAVERELARGGQVFLVHNRAQDITRMARLVKELVPQARVGVGHGQLSEKSLGKVMLAFVRRELDVLVCTTIIESGLDIPTANTIIINQADKLGLSQIYQLRGRVGRAGEMAYAYLFVKGEASLTSDAAKRLKALMDFTHLGAGFAIAMHDLQIRGAGNLLGEVQSGQVAEVGYELYMHMLEEAVAELKGEAPAEGPEPELHLSLKAFLPEDYVPDSQVRLGLYKRLSQVRTAVDLAVVKGELSDRFGPLPEPARNLLEAVGLKALLRRLFAARLDLSADQLQVHFTHQARLDLDRLLGLAERKPQEVKVHPDGMVSLKLKPQEPPLVQARDFLQYLEGNDN